MAYVDSISNRLFLFVYWLIYLKYSVAGIVLFTRRDLGGNERFDRRDMRINIGCSSQ